MSLARRLTQPLQRPSARPISTTGIFIPTASFWRGAGGEVDLLERLDDGRREESPGEGRHEDPFRTRPTLMPVLDRHNTRATQHRELSRPSSSGRTAAEPWQRASLTSIRTKSNRAA